MLNLQNINNDNTIDTPINNSSLFDAIKRNNLQDIKAFFKDMASDEYVVYSNQCNEQGYPPLSYAIEHNVSLAILKELIKKGADVNYKNDYLEAPLTIAIRLSSLDIIKTLLNYGAIPNDIDESNHNFLWDALSSDMPADIVKILLKYGASTKDKSFFSLAADWNDTEFLYILLASLNSKERMHTFLELSKENTSNRSEETKAFFSSKQSLFFLDMLASLSPLELSSSEAIKLARRSIEVGITPQDITDIINDHFPSMFMIKNDVVEIPTNSSEDISTALTPQNILSKRMNPKFSLISSEDFNQVYRNALTIMSVNKFSKATNILAFSALINEDNITLPEEISEYITSLSLELSLAHSRILFDIIKERLAITPAERELLPSPQTAFYHSIQQNTIEMINQCVTDLEKQKEERVKNNIQPQIIKEQIPESFMEQRVQKFKEKLIEAEKAAQLLQEKKDKTPTQEQLLSETKETELSDQMKEEGSLSPTESSNDKLQHYKTKPIEKTPFVLRSSKEEGPSR